MADPRVAGVAQAVLGAYRGFTAETDESQKQLAAITEHIESWFGDDGRRVSDAAKFCIEKFARGEVDHQTPGNRGFGRVTEAIPRFAARHRQVVSHMGPGAYEELGSLIRKHLTCGYLFAEYAYGLTRDGEPQLAADKLFAMWVPTIYSPLCNFDPRNDDESDIKTIWFGATGRSIRDHLQARGANWQDADMEIVTHYFDGGMLLRSLESRPLSDDQVSNIATGGAFAAERDLSAATGGKYTTEELERAVANVSHAKSSPPTNTSAQPCDGWPRLSVQELASMPEHERTLIRQHEEETIAVSKMQLADICNNCHVKPQFAKTYRVLRRDLREQLTQGRAAFARPHPQFSDAFGMAMVRSTDLIISYKLRRMADHFEMRWGEPIENWAGKEGSAIDKSGCVVVVAALGLAAASVTGVVCLITK